MVGENTSFKFNFPPGGSGPSSELPFKLPETSAPGGGGSSGPVTSEDEGFEEAPVAFGTKINRAPINRFRGIKDYNKRVAVLDTAIYAVKSHFDETLGSFRCFGTLCCEESDPAVRYLIPILVYDTDRQGTPVSGKFEVEFMALGSSYYDSLATTHKISPLTGIDLVVQCSDEKYQKLTFVPAGPALWRTNEVFANAVLERYGKLKKFIPRSYARFLGKTVPEAEATYKRLKGISAPADLAAGGGASFDLGRVVQ